ncbi:hypothetical protein, partial [Bradyrhizobium sp. 2TAF36]|uniref:hypothetical protein n=1 Tax=Bradyrhizobium sp. 2TAF36 TaxID=3233016 RepID=UPI003F8F930E
PIIFILSFRESLTTNSDRRTNYLSSPRRDGSGRLIDSAYLARTWRVRRQHLGQCAFCDAFQHPPAGVLGIEAGKHQQHPGQALFHGIDDAVDLILLQRRRTPHQVHREIPRECRIGGVRGGGSLSGSRAGLARGSPLRRARGQSTQLTSWPVDLTFNSELVAIAAKDGFDVGQAERMFKKFECHHRSKGSRFVDWTHAWGWWVCGQVDINAKAREAEVNRSDYVDPRI